MKFVVIDDDPTGSQTVHDCLLLLKWDCSTLVKGFESKSNLFFILANTRSLSENDAKLTIEEICKNLKTVITSQAYEEEIIFISRGDSTLRGHNYLEPSALNSCLGPFDLGVIWSDPPRRMICLEPWTSPRNSFVDGIRNIMIPSNDSKRLNASIQIKSLK